MHYQNYILSDEARKKIAAVEVIDTQEVSSKTFAAIPSAITDHDVRRWLKNNEQDGYSTEAHQTIREIMNKPAEYAWRTEGRPPQEPNNLDMLVFGGVIAAEILHPKEISQYEKYGFNSWTSFASTVGAYIVAEVKKKKPEGYFWLRERDGKRIITEVGKNEHYDPSIVQQDITYYPTKDPLGNDALFRPVTSYDMNSMTGGHSQEENVLISVIKYIDQQKIVPNAELIIANLNIDRNATLMDPSRVRNTKYDFVYNEPIPQLDAQWSTNEPSYHRICANTDYTMYVGPENELVFAHVDGQDRGVKTPHMIFYPDEASKLLRGLYEQARRGLVRTSDNKLQDVFRWRIGKTRYTSNST